MNRFDGAFREADFEIGSYTNFDGVGIIRLDRACDQPGGRVRLAGSGRPTGWREIEGGNLRRSAQSIRRQAADFQGQMVYGEATANFDAVIAGLVTALTEGGNPKSLPGLQTDLEHGATSLGKFCKMASDLLPSTSGRKGVVADIAKAATEPLIKGVVGKSSRYL
jgi:hypothetical protein